MVKRNDASIPARKGTTGPDNGAAPLVEVVSLPDEGISAAVKGGTSERNACAGENGFITDADNRWSGRVEGGAAADKVVVPLDDRIGRGINGGSRRDGGQLTGGAEQSAG